MTEETKTEALSFDIMDIMKMIPHRYPFLLVDRIRNVFQEKVQKVTKI